ncbi:S-adenosyl-L-methionine-dependent methyltransferase [Pilobolus umbonatus]|nr:S-adenosyl-L-methionine-dependent methyltransferase [Pilobolus umbonatus]
MFFEAFLAFFRRTDQKLFHRFKNHHKKNIPMEDTNTDTNTSSSVPFSGSSEGRNFQFIAGRRFNNDEDVAYLLPNDNDEADRLHQQHWIIRYSFQCNYHSPIKKQLQEGIQVIDAGCGPATWTFEMAETYPNSKFYGIDVSFVFPEAIKPPNVDLQICNVSKELPFDENSIDFFHQRLLVAALSKCDIQAGLKNAYKVLKPGAYIELVEPNLNGFESVGPVCANMQSTMDDMMAKKGMLANLGDHLQELLEEAGYVNIHFQTKRMPVNHTNKAGALWWQDLSHVYNSFRPMMAMQNPEWEDPDVYAEHVRLAGQECAEMKTYFIFCIAYAQKPLETEEES